MKKFITLPIAKLSLSKEQIAKAFMQDELTDEEGHTAEFYENLGLPVPDELKQDGLYETTDKDYKMYYVRIDPEEIIDYYDIEQKRFGKECSLINCYKDFHIVTLTANQVDDLLIKAGIEII